MGRLGVMNTSPDVGDTIEELSNRWLGAREAAYKKAFEQCKSECEYLIEFNSLEAEKFEEFLRLVFLNSRYLGLGYQKTKNLIWEKSDFTNFAEKLGSPCLTGIWKTKSAAHILSRNGCQAQESFGPRYCQYWREAIDGLVIGISDDVGFVRNSSISALDDKCVDVFFDEEASPTDAIWNNINRRGSLPPEIREDLEAIQQKFRELKIDLKFLGLSERNLFYKLEPKQNLTCGSAGTIYRSHLEKLISEKFPFFNLKDASPVAVYGERT